MKRNKGKKRRKEKNSNKERVNGEKDKWRSPYCVAR